MCIHYTDKLSEIEQGGIALGAVLVVAILVAGLVGVWCLQLKKKRKRAG